MLYICIYKRLVQMFIIISLTIVYHIMSSNKLLSLEWKMFIITILVSIFILNWVFICESVPIENGEVNTRGSQK